ncbi:terminase large subunit domain-containing protein [Gordonia malaquae]|uniref:terminase large subunit domain-containing protein n=1 Tax=Gordonia malaquae TaxID=410332 RepID=UPI0030FEC111
MSATASTPLRSLIGCRVVEDARAQRRAESPAELAHRLDPGFVVTPTIALLSDLAVRSVVEPDQRDIVTTPPRTGKSRLLAIWTVVWALADDPNLQVVLVSYSDELAQAHSREARQLIAEHADVLGIQLSPDKTAVGRWRVDGHKGGLLATGINSGVTGFGADLLIIDDPVKDATEADSAAHRRRVVSEYRSTLSTRVHPGGSVLLVMTRWHEQDLAGELLDAEPDVWTHTNIPAVSETGVPDALLRERRGVAMTSALGYTPDHYAAARRTSGERTWFSLYQGVPTPPDGGLMHRDWFDQWRLSAPPVDPVLTVVGVDPSDSGRGDSCGIVAASVGSDGVVAVLADRSAPMTSDQWARAAVELAIDVGASVIAVEGFTTAETYRQVVENAIDAMYPPHPIRVSPWRAKGDAVARSSALLQGLETGTVRVVGELPGLEGSAVLWQSGQHQPDQLAALVVAHDVAARAAGARVEFALPAGRIGERAMPGEVTAMDAYLRRRVSDRPA